MQIIRLNNPHALSLIIDAQLFSENVIIKTLYWLSSDYVVQLKKRHSNIEAVLEKKHGILTDAEFEQLRERISQDLIDFKTREIIVSETKTIRELLMVKAFAATDEFDGTNFMSQ